MQNLQHDRAGILLGVIAGRKAKREGEPRRVG
jgi:hypothetical protein